MGATGSALAVKDDPGSRTAEGRWKPGVSGHPGGAPRGLRELQAKVLAAHGENVLVALQTLFDLGMDPDTPAKVRVPALNAFVSHVKGAPQAPKDEKADEQVNEGELLDRVTDRLVSTPEGRERLAAKLSLVKP